MLALNNKQPARLSRDPSYHVLRALTLALNNNNKQTVSNKSRPEHGPLPAYNGWGKTAHGPPVLTKVSSDSKQAALTASVTVDAGLLE